VGANWTISGGKLNHTVGSTVQTRQNTGINVGSTYTLTYTVSGIGSTPVATDARVTAGIGATTSLIWRDVDGTYSQNIAVTGDNYIGFAPAANFAGSIDNVVLTFVSTP
jgi:hypothetical protein